MLVRLFFTAILILQSSAFAAETSVPFGAGVCAPAEALSRVLELHPDKVAWTKDLRAQCKVTAQGYFPTCWAHSGTEVLTQYLQKIKAIDATQRISSDFYESLSFRENMKRLLDKGDYVGTTPIGGIEAGFVYDHILKTGIVTDAEFQLPKIRYQTEGGLIKEASVRENSNVLFLMYDMLNKEIGHPEKIEGILDLFLGKTAQVAANPLPESFVKAFSPTFYSTHAVQEKGNIAFAETAHVHLSDNYDDIETAIQHSLDSDVAVQIDTIDSHKFKNARVSAVLDEQKPSLNPINNGHAMSIVGYRMGPNGKPDYYLIQNTWGPNFGAGGRFTLSAQGLRNHGFLFGIYNPKQLNFKLR